MNHELSLPAVDVNRCETLFREHRDSIYKRTDRIFANLMVLQWLAGIAAALWISPRTWIGAESQTHLHVWAAILIGGVIMSFPVALAWLRPGQMITRQSIAIGQMLTSALLIHLTGGRIETHFHVFGSLAFLAIYRDRKVLITATLVVAVDHFARGVFWPQSVFGVLVTSSWRWVEHAGWVIFEDVFLLITISQSLREMRQIAQRQAGLESVNQGVEKLVRERTRELEQTHKELLEVSRQAGMAEVATSVLHNVGNVLNSVNISAQLVSDLVAKSKGANLAKAVAMMNQHAGDLGAFMTADPKGRQLPGYLGQLADQLAQERGAIVTETDSLRKNIDHIKDIVAMQQGYAKVSGTTELVKVSDLLEDALRMNVSALIRHEVKYAREYDPNTPEIMVERHKVLQILVNLIRNAKHACEDSGLTDKQLTLRVATVGDTIEISVADNGIGIASENMSRVFNYGFTTKKEGHGFGLHSGALAARELGGNITVHSEGAGKGAVFTLQLPIHLKPSDLDIQDPKLHRKTSDVATA